ncbi:MAG: hypothetical protein ABJ246_10550 [Paracoccaceae bacterium]
MKKLINSILSVLGLAAGSVAGITYASPAEFAAQAREGQVYSCLSDEGDFALALKLFRIEEQDAVGLIYHVQVIPVQPEGLPMIGHAPFSGGSFENCMIDPELEALLSEPFDVTALESGYATWKDTKGGVFTISVIEATKSIFSIAHQGDNG